MLAKEMKAAIVNRHTGGLERDNVAFSLNENVNRHTGGLENSMPS